MDTTQLLKGVLDVAVLAVIQEDDGYGYDIVRRLRAAGLDEVGDASVYGTLRRLYSAGALSTYVVPSEGGPHRKYYGINAEGRAMLADQRASWGRFAGTMTLLLKDPAITGAATSTRGAMSPSGATSTGAATSTSNEASPTVSSSSASSSPVSSSTDHTPLSTSTRDKS